MGCFSGKHDSNKEERYQENEEKCRYDFHLSRISVHLTQRAREGHLNGILQIRVG